MSCEERLPEVWLLAADGLGEEEARALRSHIEGCSACQRHLGAASSALENHGEGLAPVEPPATVRERLIARASSSPGARPSSASLSARGSRWLSDVGSARTRPGQLAVAAVAGALLGGLVATQANRVLQHPTTEALNFELGVLRDGDTFQKRRMARLERRVNELEQGFALQLAEAHPHGTATVGPGFERAEAWVALLESAQGGEAPKTEARVFCVAQEHLCQFQASGLPPTPPGASYALWVTNLAGRYYLVGTFTVDGSGEANLLAAAPARLGGLARSLVTLENGEADWRPQGSVVLVEGSQNVAGVN